MKSMLLTSAAALAFALPCFASQTTIADRCIAHVSKGAIKVYRDVDVLASGRDRIAYFRCVRSGMRDDTGASAVAGFVPHIATGFGGSGGFTGVTLSL
jgi:hypothetical protein